MFERLATSWHARMHDTLSPWMEHDKGIAQKAAVDMGIDLGCNDRFMSQHFLNCPEIGTGFNHMSGK